MTPRQVPSSTSRDLTVNDVYRRYEQIHQVEGFGFWSWSVRTNTFETYGKLWGQLGYSQREIEEIAAEKGFRGFVHPEDIELVTNELRRFLRAKRRIDVTYRVLARNGGSLWVQSRGEGTWDEQGRAVWVYGSIVDVTELVNAEDALRESEARHHRIIDASNDGIWEWYAEGGYFHFSSRCWEQLGYDKDDDAMNEGKNRYHAWRKLIHPDDHDCFVAAIDHHWETLERVDIEYRILAKDGTYRWIRTRGKGVLDAHGEPWRMSGTNIDITEIKESEEKVLRAKEQAENANRAKSDFLSSMSHELRTPLNAILGFTQLFDYDNNLSADQRENIREIRKAGNHLLQLINDVLDLSKIEAGRVSLSLEPVLPARIVEECMALLRPLAARHKVSLQFRAAELLDQYVLADAVRLKQALLNIMSNAIKYNREQGYVDINFSRIGEQLAIAVKDGGRGLSPAAMDGMYEPFNRLGAERSNIEGTGVGLIITKRLIEMMGGDLTCESVEGQGSTFTCVLALADDWSNDAADQLEQLGYCGKKTVAINVTEPKRVLYIEDNQSNVRVMERVFERIPEVELDVADEPFLGIYKARRHVPNLVIMDINLPGIDGYEALGVLQNDPITQRIPVVAVSANAMKYDVEKGINAGFYAYLTKPLDVRKLLFVLNSAMAESDGQPLEAEAASSV